VESWGSYKYAFTKASGAENLVLVFPLEDVPLLELLETGSWDGRGAGKDRTQDAIDLFRNDELIAGSAAKDGIVESEGEGVLNHDDLRRREYNSGRSS
jgi:hypothetical protein